MTDFLCGDGHLTGCRHGAKTINAGEFLLDSISSLETIALFGDNF
jgi:hypothetical protein